MVIEIIKFIVYSLCIVIVAKYILVKLLRKLAEALQLSPKSVGNIAGVATSVPELLTVGFSAFAGLLSTSIYNIISSNIINMVQYLFSLFLSKNVKMLKNKAIAADIVLAIITILIPVLMMLFHIEFSIQVVPIFILLFILFYLINVSVHRKYLREQDEEIEEEIRQEEKNMKSKVKIMILYSFFLLLTAVALYFIGDALSNVLENLAGIFSIPEWVLGMALGFITSLPELITFFEAQKHYKNSENSELGVVEATNNLLTSNLLNLFIIQTIGIVIAVYFSSF